MPSWFHFRTPPLPDDPAVAAVEQLLGPAAHQAYSADPVVVEHALSICACVSVYNAPCWLIYDSVERGLRWRRVTDPTAFLDGVDPRFVAAGHADPAEVLRWLQGQAPDPWDGGSGDGDPTVLDALRSAINAQ